MSWSKIIISKCNHLFSELKDVSSGDLNKLSVKMKTCHFSWKFSLSHLDQMYMSDDIS